MKPSWTRFETSWGASGGLLEAPWRIRGDIVGLKTCTFRVILSMLQRTAGDLVQFVFLSSFEKWFGRVGDGLGLVFGLV